MHDKRKWEIIELSQWLTELGVSWNGELADLQDLYLDMRNISSIPTSIRQLTNLQNLHISGNSLARFPESLSQLTSLQGLYLGSNKLTHVPESIGQLRNLQKLDLMFNKLTSIPKSIFQLTNLQELYLNENKLTKIPESLGQLTNLQILYIGGNQLSRIPESIVRLINLQSLYLDGTQLVRILESIKRFVSLKYLHIGGNQLTDLSFLKRLPQKYLEFYYLDVELPRRYWTKFSYWQPEWLLDEDNAEIRRVLIQQVGYEKICDRLNAEAIDTWREYELLKIDGVEAVYREDEDFEDEDEDNFENDEPIAREPLVMLKMTCPSTGHIHILRVPPEMTSAEAAITWVNHGIHPDEIAVQT